MNSNTNNNDGRRFKWGREIKAPEAGLEYELIGQMKRATDPKEIEAKRLAIAQEAEDVRLAEIQWDERDRDIKEWKAANPESKTHPWMSPAAWAIATNAPCGWGNDYYRLKEVLAIDEELYRQLAQQAMDDGGNAAYAIFTENMYSIANAEGKRLYGVEFKTIVSPSCLGKAQDKRSYEGGVK